MPELFRTGPLYQRTYDCGKKYVVHQGGTSSGKTYTILQVLFVRCIENPGSVATVVGQDLPNLKRGAMRMALKIWLGSETLKKLVLDFNQSDRYFRFKNGSIMEFTSFDDEQDAKSGKRHFTFINEANGVQWPIAFHLFLRTNDTFKDTNQKNQCFIDYNPTTSFWVHKHIIGRPDCEFIISDHRSNPYLTADVHREIEDINDTDLWRVYARGLTGDIKGIIYPNWTEVPEFPKEYNELIWGIDYGYTVDPTAIVKIACNKQNNVCLHEIAYTPGLSESAIIEVMKANGFVEGMPFYSEHDPEKVSQIRAMGVPVYMASKGPDSIKNGIMKVKQFNVSFTAQSHHIREERAGYKWQEVTSYDGSGIQIVNQPDPKYRAKHLLDAARYAIYTHFFKM